MSRDRFSCRWFLVSAAGILAVTGAAKLWSAFGEARLLDLPDPVFGFEFRLLFLTVGVAELVVALACLYDKQAELANGAVLWMAGNFLVYRVGLACLGWSHCHCLGSLTDQLHVPAGVADAIMCFLLGYLLLGSSIALVLRRRRRGAE